MTLDIIVPIIIIIYCLVIISLLWRPARNNKTAFYLSYATFGTLLWTASILVTVIDRNAERVVFWSRLSFFFPILIVYSLYRFNSYFIAKEEKKKIYGPITKLIIYLLIAAGIFFALISFTPFIIADVKDLKSTFGPLQSYYSFFILIAFLIVSINLTRGFFLVDKKLKAQFGYVLLGVIMSSIIGVITNLFIPMITHLEIRYLGPLGVIFFLSFTAYAIIKKQLFDIKIFVTELFSALLVISLIINVIYSKSLIEVILKVAILLLAAYSGYRLVTYVNKETEQNLRIQKLNLRLEKDKKELIELDRMKDEFLQMATHELNTPITVIQGKLDMAVRENLCKLNPEQKAFFEPVLEDTMRLAGMSKDILNTTRIDQNRLKLNPTKIDLNKLVYEIVSDFQIETKEKGNILIYNQPAKPLPEIIVDQSKISEVINNLINNANKFTEKGKVTVDSEANNNKIIVSVSDTGCGIDEKDQKRIFEKFYQAGRFDPDHPKEQQGSGLGLYISKNIVSLHGGEMWLKSIPNKGSVFYFSLPLEYKEK